MTRNRLSRLLTPIAFALCLSLVGWPAFDAGAADEEGRAKGRELVAEHKADTQEDLDRRAREAQDPGSR